MSWHEALDIVSSTVFDADLGSHSFDSLRQLVGQVAAWQARAAAKRAAACSRSKQTSSSLLCPNANNHGEVLGMKPH